MTNETDLFGHKVPPAVSKSGKPKRPATKRNGYAGIPGNGPDGETCGTCQHKTVRKLSKRYLKCELCRASWTGGQGSDILARSPACEYWEKRVAPVDG